MNKKQLSILLISPLPPPAGGIASWTQKYITWFKEKNQDVSLIDTAVIGNRLNTINSKRNIFQETIRTIKIIWSLKKKVTIKRIDICHLNSSCGTFGVIRDYLSAQIIKKKMIPIVLHYHCNIEDQLKNNPISKYYFKKLTLLSDICIVLNKKSLEYINSQFKIKVKLLPNFIDKEYILEKPKDIKPTIQKIVFIGHVQLSKGIKELIESAKHFPEIEFIVVGPVSDDLSMYKTSENIILKGETSMNEVKQLLDDADIFLFPTYSEGFSIALLEAMSRGVPVITTNVGANVDMIENKGGILVKVGNSNEIIKAIHLLQDNKIRSNMSNWNIAKVTNYYSIDYVMAMLMEIYNDFENQ